MVKKIYLAIITIIVVGLLAVRYSYNRNNTILENKLISAIATGMEIDIQKITPFEWDKLYVFEPYTYKEQISTTLGFKWSRSAPSYDELQLLVFVRQDKVVSSITFPRYPPGADFLTESNSNVYLPNEAIFVNENNKLIKK